MGKEYIEREAAKNAIFEYICGHTMSKFPSAELLRASKMGAEGALNEIDDVPTADVAEVKHGEWMVKDYNNPAFSMGYKVYCSCCGYQENKGPAWNIEWGVHPYCPNCGAKMDGGKSK